ncbi:hypothetical protein [Nocardioides dongxiaopingii]|uniref:hypothetical protein n=1 Tax=Nocardioides dongxiaopingii TaxID=2576036 RepID=UPI001484FD1B|nr:hypothetical protein [Nocardioides dongxiaopingii]
MVRSCIVVGTEYEIACAVRSDGSSPARELLDLLKVGEWADDPDVERVPDPEQVRDYHRLIDMMRTLATAGEPERQRDVRYLRDGLWEFAVGAKRLVFYDTDGRGAFTPKPRIQDKGHAPYPDTEFWWFPLMDRQLRLANYWPKVSEKADPIDIEEAIKIREEDLRYDKED